MAAPAYCLAPIRVMIADDHPIMRFGLRQLLEAQPDLRVVAEASSLNDVLTLVHRLCPDVLLLDFSVAGHSGIEVMRELKDSPTKVIFFTGNAGKQDLIEGLRLGLRGVVAKSTPTDVLLKSIRCVAAGEYWIDRKSLAECATRAAQTPANSLTRRECEITAEVVNGASNKLIARKFGISEDTVKRHLTNIYDKVGVSTRLELTLLMLNNKALCPQCVLAGESPRLSVM
jgi:two-component system nitrate/nitrite response regulator NarL